MASFDKRNRLWHGGFENFSEEKRSLAGDSRGEGPPGPISNPAVKLTSADDTTSVGRWESRSLPAKQRFSFLDSLLQLFR